MPELPLYSEKEFTKLALATKYAELKSKGCFCANRGVVGPHLVSLFSYNGYFIETYKSIETGKFVFIEVQTNQQVLDEYASTIDLQKALKGLI